jgi:hypothetical protein
MLETSTQIPVSTIIYMDKTNIKNKLNESTILFNILKYYEMKDI